MNKTFMSITAIAVLALVGIFVVFSNGEETTTTTEPDQSISQPTEIKPQDHVAGSAQAPVTLIEYGDFQCPACRAAYPFVQQLKQEYGDQVAVVFRHFPLTAIHQNALPAARAAEAAAKQGAFWELHDLLFERQEEWANAAGAASIFEDYAEELGLNVEQFNTDRNSQSVQDAVAFGQKSGQQLNVNSTPTFFLNGERIQNPGSYEALQSQVEAVLSQQDPESEPAQQEETKED